MTQSPEPELLITAEEAFPAFERAVLSARRELIAGFRLFDLTTQLRAPEARAVGQDWFDLLLDAARRGVAIRITLSDFDPVVGTPLHGATWRTMRLAAALREVAPPGASVEVTAAMHPARLRWGARLALWPKVQLMLGDHVRQIANMDAEKRGRFLSEHPGLAAKLNPDASAPRRWVLPDLSPVTHHQKVAVIDGEVLYCGGLDLNERRFDTKAHDRPADQTWHDVQIILRDPEQARAARSHLREFVAVTQRRATPSTLGGKVRRTLSAKTGQRRGLFSPKYIARELEETILTGIEGAKDLIYLETQFLRSRRIAAALARAARARDRLRLFLVLPGAPEEVAFLGSSRSDARFGEFLQATCVRKVRRAFRDRAFIGAPVRPVRSDSDGRDTLHGAPLVYVHAKVAIFDTNTALISSANLNGRSLRWDTEFGAVVTQPNQVEAMRHRLLDHWTGPEGPESAALTDPARCVAAWQAQAQENVALTPADRVGFLVPYRTGPGARFGRKLPGVPEEMV